MRQTLARSLLDSVASAVKTLAVPISRIPTQKDSGNKTSQVWRVQKEDITAYTLAKQYVLLLCRLDLLEVRQIFVFFMSELLVYFFTLVDDIQIVPRLSYQINSFLSISIFRTASYL